MTQLHEPADQYRQASETAPEPAVSPVSVLVSEPAAAPASTTGSVQQQAALKRAETLIREIADYPSPGILFRDVMPLLADAEAFQATVHAMIEPFMGEFDVVAGIEARGFLFASAAAMVSATGLVPVRKAGKLPVPADSVSYELEYGSAVIEMQADLAPGSRILLIDDVLATGGTARAARQLISRLGYAHVATSVLFEIDGLGGREALAGSTLHTVFSS